jgi:hypothetical protein
MRIESNRYEWGSPFPRALPSAAPHFMTRSNT